MYSRSQVAQVKPPLDFLPAGRVTWARIADEPPAFILKARERVRGNRRAGQLYEHDVHWHFKKICQYYMPGPWLVFSEAGNHRTRWCQLDGLILDFMQGRLTIVEVKLRHTARAWWQVRRLYEPVLKCILPEANWEYRALEVSKHIDPSTSFPEKLTYVTKPDEVPAGAFGIHLFTGR